jgi:hypothetical protein
MLLTNETTNWAPHNLSLEICKLFSRNFKNLVIAETWMPRSKSRAFIETWLNLNQDHKVVIISMFDPVILNESTLLDIDRDRITMINTTDICFWLLAVDRYFLNYSIRDVSPIDFKYKFLCYQRKLTDQREFLYNQLLEKSGIVTIGDKNFDNINRNIPDHIGFNEEGGASSLETPCDVWSLGNIDIWNSSFLNIVSETQQPFDGPFLFVSEKTFKPIIGMRPFICFGHPETTKLLNSLGFETFDQEFNYRPSSDWKDNAKQIIDIVDHLDYGMYKSLIPKLLHNKNQLKKAAIVEWEKVDSLAKQYY